MKPSALVGGRQVRRKAALVADVGVVARRPQLFLERVEDLGAHPHGVGELSAPTGMIMNSWMSIGLSACAPPLMMFIIGTGRTCADGAADIAVKRQAGGIPPPPWRGQRLTPRMALAPSRALLGCRRARSSHVDGDLILGVDAR
jgi:hypothetical protein